AGIFAFGDLASQGCRATDRHHETTRCRRSAVSLVVPRAPGATLALCRRPDCSDGVPTGGHRTPGRLLCPKPDRSASVSVGGATRRTSRGRRVACLALRAPAPDAYAGS